MKNKKKLETSDAESLIYDKNLKPKEIEKDPIKKLKVSSWFSLHSKRKN